MKDHAYRHWRVPIGTDKNVVVDVSTHLLGRDISRHGREEVVGRHNEKGFERTTDETRNVVLVATLIKTGG